MYLFDKHHNEGHNMTTYTISSHTADEWRAQAADSSQRSRDSWERSDTDGFLSQWANDQTARMMSQLATWADNGGDVQPIAWPMILTSSDPSALSTWVPVQEFRWVKGQYGSSVRIWHDGQVSWWNPSAASKAATARRNDERKGFRWARVSARVEAVTYSAGMMVGLALRPVTDDSDSIVEVLDDADYHADGDRYDS